MKRPLIFNKRIFFIITKYIHVQSAFYLILPMPYRIFSFYLIRKKPQSILVAILILKAINRIREPKQNAIPVGDEN